MGFSPQSFVHNSVILPTKVPCCHAPSGILAESRIPFKLVPAGADPRFFDKGFKFKKGVRLCELYLIIYVCFFPDFSEMLHENILSQTPEPPLDLPLARGYNSHEQTH